MMIMYAYQYVYRFAVYVYGPIAERLALEPPTRRRTLNLPLRERRSIFSPATSQRPTSLSREGEGAG
jgi:hypothetical protein